MSQATLATSAQTRVVVNNNYTGRSRVGRTGTTLKTVGRFLAVTLDGDTESALYLPSELDQIAPTQTAAPAATVTPQTERKVFANPALGAPYDLSARTALRTARTIAVELAKKDGQVTADGVQEELQKRGINLGNAIGSLFTSFVNTGRTVKSTRQGNRGRRILVWALPGSAVATGATPAPIVPTEGPFVVQVKSNHTNGWERSWNSTADGRRLQETEFATRVEAEKEAARHQTDMRNRHPFENYLYRAAEV